MTKNELNDRKTGVKTLKSKKYLCFVNLKVMFTKYSFFIYISGVGTLLTNGVHSGINLFKKSAKRCS